MPSRRSVLLALLAVLAVGFGAPSTRLVGGVREASAAVSRPNILVIVTDDERTDEMQYMPMTRQIFADGGTAYPKAYVETPLCCPSRATIMTGRYSHNHHVTKNTRYRVFKLDFKTTAARYLKAHGYQTGIAGKIFNEWPENTTPPYYDHYAVMRGGYDNVPFNVDGTEITSTGYSTDFISDEAVDFLDDFEATDSKPWYLYLAPFAPHWNYTPADQDSTMFVPPLSPSPARTEIDRSDKPPSVRARTATLASMQNAWIGQVRTLQDVDRMVARVFALLDQLGESNTLAFFISDNGYLLAEHGVGEDKLFPYTPAINVPMYMRWPGHVAAGAVDDRRVLNADIAPTALDAAGIAPPTSPPMDGRSLLKSYARSRTFVESFAGGEPEVPLPNSPPVPPAWATDVTDTYQYTEWYESDGTTVSFREYYDLTKDPEQLTNLLADGKPGNNPPKAVLAALHERLARDRHCAGTTGSSACP